MSGGRKNVIMHADNQQLIYDMIHLQRKPAILCINGSKPCYDRIVHSVASMEMQRLGIPAKPMKCILGMLQDLEHHIRTAYGTWE